MPQRIDGKQISTEIKAELKTEVEALQQKGHHICLAVIQVGEDPASTVYVRNKERSCGEIGIESRMFRLPLETTETELLKLIDDLNADSCVNGILVQLPLPGQIREKEVINRIDPSKDVDGFHPINVGRLSIGEKCPLPCTPAGIIELLKRTGIQIEGKECVVIGRSNIVGKPMAQLMLKENATVTMAHSRTPDLKGVSKRADILIVAIGKAKFITRDYVKEGAVVIDVGMDRDENGKLCGDVDYADVAEKTTFITPVPGGVGPMTIAMLMNNCVDTARER